MDRSAELRRELYLQPIPGTMMKSFPLASLCLSAILPFTGCRRSAAKPPSPAAVKTAEASKAAAPGVAGAQVPLRYATVFSLETRAETTVVIVKKPWQGAQSDFTYLLVPRRDGGAMDSAATGAATAAAADGSGTHKPQSLVVPVPLRRVITLTTTNLRDFESLGVLDALVGLGGGRYVCSPAVRARLQSGRLRDVGTDVGLDVENVVALRPDLLITFVVGNSSDGGRAKLAETGVPVAVEGSYMEETPLGRAEWIKFTGAFFGKTAEADSIFASVDSAYQALAALARTAKRKPTVFVGAPFGGVWWMASGRTYVGRLLADAGADYLWAADTTRGSLSLDVEAVLGRAAGADFWINAGEWKDLADARAKDPRNALFKAWKDGHVYVNDAIRCESGGRDFYETGAARPDLILADLIAILHPELLPGHSLRWYRKLPEGR
jgi:iron complex transport system substrate-binding protein